MKAIGLEPRIDPATVVGWAADEDPSNNPTAPMRDLALEGRGLDWPRPALQPEDMEVLMSTEHARLPAVFGTSAPPRGLSGMIRRRAFAKSEGKWSHWLLLLMADRVNVVEGLADDLAHGHLPDFAGEMGLRTDPRYNVLKWTAGAAAVGVCLAMVVPRARRRRRLAAISTDA